jgi:predicted secreted protein
MDSPARALTHAWLFRAQRSAAMLCALLLLGAAQAQDRPAAQDVLELNASASSEVVADTAVVTLSVVKDGNDVALLTQDASNLLDHALTDARATPAVTANSGGFSTQPRNNDRGATVGWSVHADLILKSHDFVALGKLVNRLTSATGGMQITASNFEVSNDLRSSEESDLITRAITSFKNKANIASKALGYNSWTIRSVNVGQVSNVGSPRPMLAMRAAPMASSAGAVMPLEAGRVTLEVAVSGSVQMRH